MQPIQAIILGVIQGLTEFLPISSSGHLLLAHYFLDWNSSNDLIFDSALHVGTVVAVLAYFWNDFWNLAVAFVRAVLAKSFDDPMARLAAWIIVGTIPAVIAGVLLESAAESAFRDPRLVAVSLIVVAGVMWLAERAASLRLDEKSISWVDSLLIGCAQAIALIPGVSRSGITISAGLFRGLRRESAARFSFLLATPVTIGAAAKEVLRLAPSAGSVDIGVYVLGILSSGIVGFLCIAFLLRYLQRHSLGVFIVYRVVLGLVLLAVTWPRG